MIPSVEFIFKALTYRQKLRTQPINSQLDLDKAQQVVELLNGEHDFRAFCFNPRPDDKTIRTLDMSFEQERTAIFTDEKHCPFNIYQFKFKSHAFLHNQVRRMMGALITYASYGRTTLDTLKTLLDKSDQGWKHDIIIAEPYGLFLRRLNYNKECEYMDLRRFLCLTIFEFFLTIIL